MSLIYKSFPRPSTIRPPILDICTGTMSCCPFQLLFIYCSHGHNDLPKFYSSNHHNLSVTKVPATVTFAKLKAKEPVTAAMSASEIQSWISSSTNEGEENGDQRVWQRDRVLNDWPRSLEYAQSFLLNGKTQSRILFLQDEILSLAKLGGFYSIHHYNCPSLFTDLPFIS